VALPKHRGCRGPLQSSEMTPTKTRRHRFLTLRKQEPSIHLGKTLGRVEHAESSPPLRRLSLALEVHLPLAGLGRPTQ